MSRLIDSDKLLDDMKKELEKAVNDENLDKDECMVILTSAIALKDFVNRQPTAFDVNKVVKHIEECNRMIEKDMEKKIDRELRMYYEGQLFIANEIIKLIKRGEIDD